MYKFVLLNAGLALAALSGANGIVVNSNPRESSVQVGGISHLARMTDKAQLATEGKLPGDLQFPCPNDKKLCSSLGIQPENFRFMVVNSENDQALGYKILDAVGTHTLMALQHPRFKKHTDPSQMKGC